MADVTGPISTLPGRGHAFPDGTMCDAHPDRPATKRIQGETDSFGCEMHDMCQECYDAYREEIKNEDTSGTCEWCHTFADKLTFRRDYEEGMSGRVYQVCQPCIVLENKQLDDELRASGFDDDWDEPLEWAQADAEEDRKREEEFYKNLSEEATDQEDVTWSVVLACSNTRNQYKMFTYYVVAKNAKAAIEKATSWLPRQYNVDDPSSCRATIFTYP